MKIIRLLGLLVLLVTTLPTQAAECTSLSKKDVLQKEQVISIESEGKYCLSEDIEVNEISQFVLSEGGFKYRTSTAIATQVPNISIDLKQHSLISQSSITKGAQGVAIGESHTSLKNGTLRVIGKQGVSVIHRPSGVPYITVLDEKKEIISCLLIYPECEEVSYLDSIDHIPPKYQVANITIDNMNIYATYRGVVLADNHNIIRNSTIEVDDNTAIYLMGQNPIIENNTIIIHSNKNNDSETQKKYNIQIRDGAIKLRDAKGAIIRNNRIIYKGGLLSWGNAPVAINLLDSKDVLIEGNTIEGFDKLVRENGDTSFIDKNNTFK